MKIEKLPSGSYRARKTYKKKTYTIVLPYKPTEKELTIMFAEKFTNSNSDKKAGGTFLHYANRYIESRNSVTSPATVRTYKGKIKQLSDHFKALNLYDITEEDVQYEINDFFKTHAPKTTRDLNGFIMAVLNKYRKGLAWSIKLPDLEEEDEYVPENKDIKKILKHAEGTRYSIPFQLGVLGLRRAEICALTMDDIEDGWLHINKDVAYLDGEWILKHTPKTSASNRSFELPKDLLDEINEAGVIFDGHPNALNKAIHRYQKKLGLQEFKFHLLRSYFVSYCHSKGIPDLYIQDMGGWETDRCLKKHYKKKLRSETNKAMKKITRNILS